MPPSYLSVCISEDAESDRRSNNVLHTRKNKSAQIRSYFGDPCLWGDGRGFIFLPTVNPEKEKAAVGFKCQRYFAKPHSVIAAFFCPCCWKVCSPEQSWNDLLTLLTCTNKELHRKQLPNRGFHYISIPSIFHNHTKSTFTRSAFQLPPALLTQCITFPRHLTPSLRWHFTFLSFPTIPPPLLFPILMSFDFLCPLVLHSSLLFILPSILVLSGGL